ncbi:MAG: DUF1269 domain-containing protein [Sphingobacteriales bacterium]|nr:MAG: DUF1269 domain-containing protein [Sphingobacteriales bacterium]
MNKMLIAVFETEQKAYEGLTALKSLHANGDITLYANAVIHKDQNGKILVLNRSDEGPVGTGVGLITGSLLGLLGGPLGLAIGAVTGSMAGLIYDVNVDDVNTRFADDVATALSNGKTAIVCEIDETWAIPVDTKMQALNGVVFRRLRYEVEDEQINREAEAISNEYKQLKEEFIEAREADKAKIKTSIEKLKNKAQVVNNHLKNKMEESKNQFDAKVNAMKDQMKNANEKRKAKLQKRIDALTQEYNARSAKLKQAAKLVGEAFEIGKKEEVPVA